MPCCGGNDEEDAANKATDLQMRNAKKALDRVVKLLLLGAGESGKSTIFKQMKILYGEKTTVEERRAYTKVVFNNTIATIKILMDQANKWGLLDKIADQEALNIIDTIEESSIVDSKVGNAISKIWNDQTVQSVWNRRNEFQIVDSMIYFFQNIQKIMAADYLATDEDYLYCRVRTTGVVTTKYIIGGVPFEMYDVGGQRNERRKWIHFFDNVTAVIFVAALSEYDQVLFEDSNKNRMEEALDLFKEICALDFFSHSAILLFLNKHDLFEEKLPKYPIRNTPLWNDYNGSSLMEAEEYFKAKFLACNMNAERSIFTRFTQATSTSNIEFVFNAARSIILDQNVVASGF